MKDLEADDAPFILAPPVRGKLRLDVTIPGEPPTKARARTFTGEDGKSHTRTPTKTRSWEQIATAHFRMKWGTQNTVAGKPMVLDITAVATRPKSLKNEGPGRLPCISAPDVDNIAKIAMDALAPSRTTKAKAWACVLADDRIIAELTVRKVYGAVGEAPHLHLRLWDQVSLEGLTVAERELVAAFLQREAARPDLELTAVIEALQTGGPWRCTVCQDRCATDALDRQGICTDCQAEEE